MLATVYIAAIHPNIQKNKQTNQLIKKTKRENNQTKMKRAENEHKDVLCMSV